MNSEILLHLIEWPWDESLFESSVLHTRTLIGYRNLKSYLLFLLSEHQKKFSKNLFTHFKEIKIGASIG